MSLCSWKSIFGDPGTGAHAYRIFNIAVVDVLATVILALVISRRHFWKVLGVLFLVGILAHRVFCVRTTVDKLLFS